MSGSSGEFPYGWSATPADKSRTAPELVTATDLITSNVSANTVEQSPLLPNWLSNNSIRRHQTNEYFDTVSDQIHSSFNQFRGVGNPQFSNSTDVFSPSSVSFESPPIIAEEDTAEVPYARRDRDTFIDENMLYKEKNRPQMQEKMENSDGIRGVTPALNSTLSVQEKFIDVNRSDNSTNAVVNSTITSQSSLKPNVSVNETNYQHQILLSLNRYQVTNDWPPNWEDRANIGASLDIYPAQHATKLEHQSHFAGESCRIENSNIFDKESNLNMSSNNPPNLYNFSVPSASNLSIPLVVPNTIRNIEEPFHDISNQLERLNNEQESVNLQDYLVQEDYQLQSRFLNGEMVEFDIGYFENTETSASYAESLGRQTEQSKKASHTQVEENSINLYQTNHLNDRFKNIEVYIDASNQTSDVDLEKSNYAVEFRTDNCEKSVERDETVKTYELWEEERNGQLKPKVDENRTSSPVKHVTPDESVLRSLTSHANLGPELLGATADIAHDNPMIQVTDNNYLNTARKSVTFGNHEEGEFYDSRMKEIDAIDTALSSVEEQIERDSYDTAKTEDIIPRTMEITVMPLTHQPGHHPLLPEMVQQEKSSETPDPAEELSASNVSEPSTAQGVQPCLEAGSQCGENNAQDHYEGVLNETSLTKTSSPSQMAAQAMCSTSLYMQDAPQPEKLSDDEHAGLNLDSGMIFEPDNLNEAQEATSNSTINQMVDKNEEELVTDEAEEKLFDESKVKANETIRVALSLEGKNTDSDSTVFDINSSSRRISTERSQCSKRKRSEGENENDLTGTMDINMLPLDIFPENDIPFKKEAQKILEIHSSAGKLLELHKLSEFREESSEATEMGPFVVTDQQSEVKITQPPKEAASIKVQIYDLSSERSVSETLTEMEAHTSNEPLPNYQIEQAPQTNEELLPTENPCAPENQKSIEELSGQIYSGQLTGSSFPEASSRAKLDQTSEPPALSKTEHIPLEAKLQSMTPTKRASGGSPEKEHMEVVIESRTTSYVEPCSKPLVDPVPSSSGPAVQIYDLSSERRVSETLTEMEAHTSNEPLPNYQIEQAPQTSEEMLPTKNPCVPENQISVEDLSGQIYSGQLTVSSLPEALSWAKLDETSEPPALSETEHINEALEAKPQSMTPTKKASAGSSENEQMEVVIESRTTCCVEPCSKPLVVAVPSSSGPAVRVKRKVKKIDSVKARIPQKKKKIIQKSRMKLRAKGTRKSSRVKKRPERLLYVGKGQLF